jgi:hypothetical protein
VNHPRLTGGVIIQTVSEFFGSFRKPKIKKRGKRKKQLERRKKPRRRVGDYH